MDLTSNQTALLLALREGAWPEGLKRGLCHVHGVGLDDFADLCVFGLVRVRGRQIALTALGRLAARDALRRKEGKPL
jgi:hypothetical protein